MNKFQRLRNKLKLTQEQCAKVLKKSTATIQKYESEAPKEIITKMEKMLEAKDA